MLQLEAARERGRWDTWLLSMAATDLSKILNEDKIRLTWKDAYDVRVWGFHEAKCRVEGVRATAPLVKWLLNFTKQIVAGRLRKPARQ